MPYIPAGRQHINQWLMIQPAKPTDFPEVLLLSTDSRLCPRRKGPTYYPEQYIA